MSLVVQFVGGPLDGETRELQNTPPIYREAWYEHNTGERGEHVYRLSARYKLPPFRYEFIAGGAA